MRKFLTAFGLAFCVATVAGRAHAQQQVLIIGAENGTSTLRKVNVDAQGRLQVTTATTISDGGVQGSTVIAVGPDGGQVLVGTVPRTCLGVLNDAGFSHRNIAVSTSALTTVPFSSLRAYSQVCNNPKNSGSPALTCTDDGQTPTTAATSVGDVLYPGDCVQFNSTSVVSCIADTASTYALVYVCDPLPLQ